MAMVVLCGAMEIQPEERRGYAGGMGVGRRGMHAAQQKRKLMRAAASGCTKLAYSQP
jgi:hypothetical protein